MIFRSSERCAQQRSRAIVVISANIRCRFTSGKRDSHTHAQSMMNNSENENALYRLWISHKCRMSLWTILKSSIRKTLLYRSVSHRSHRIEEKLKKFCVICLLYHIDVMSNVDSCQRLQSQWWIPKLKLNIKLNILTAMQSKSQTEK